MSCQDATIVMNQCEDHGASVEVVEFGGDIYHVINCSIGGVSYFAFYGWGAVTHCGYMAST